MTVCDWLTMFTDLYSYEVQICIFDLRVGKCVWNSADKCEALDLISEVADGDYGNHELLSVSLYHDYDAACLDLNIETEEEDDE